MCKRSNAVSLIQMIVLLVLFDTGFGSRRPVYNVKSMMIHPAEDMASDTQKNPKTISRKGIPIAVRSYGYVHHSGIDI